MGKKSERLAWGSAFILAMLIFAARPALATDISVTDDGGFGTLVGSVTSGTPNLVSNLSNDFSATVTESVFLCSNAGGCSDVAGDAAANGSYTYVFTVLNASSSTNSLTTFNTSTNGLTVDAFNSSLNYGIVGGTFTTGGSPNTSGGCQSPTNGFCFGPANLKLFLGAPGGSDLPPSDQITFYAQSIYGPMPGSFTALNDGSATAAVLDPGPEPRSILLFGTGLLVFGVSLRRRILSV